MGRQLLLLVQALAVIGWPEPAAATPGGSSDAEETPVVLPRYVVSAMRVERRPWRYVAVPGFEVLTRASDHDTFWSLDALRRGRWLEDQLLPAEWLPPAPLAYTVILDDTDPAELQRPEWRTEPMEFRPPEDAAAWAGSSLQLKTWTDRIRASDPDTYALNSNLHGVDTTSPAYGWISIERLARCAPPLPRWLTAGLTGQRCGFFRAGFVPLADPEEPQRLRPDAEHRRIRKVAGPAILWISVEETQRLQAKWAQENKRRRAGPEPPAAAANLLIPLREFFGEAPPREEARARWESQAALLVRWGLWGADNRESPHRAAFVAFAERARREPVSEAVFADCFGFGFAAAERELTTFLKQVLGRPVLLEREFPADFDQPPVQTATAGQIGRILGDWLRLQSHAIAAQDPVLSTQLLAAAGRVLERAAQSASPSSPDADRAPRPTSNPTAATGAPRVRGPAPLRIPTAVADPDLLATCGLYEYDAGNPAAAREFLERAIRAGAARPRAQFALAQLRFKDALAEPAGADRRLSPEQAEHVTAPLVAALRSSAAADCSALIVDVWFRCEAHPPTREIERIIEGTTLYPRLSRLTYRAAVLCAHAGRPAEAGQLIEAGLRFVVSDSDRADLLRLQTALGSTPAARNLPPALPPPHR